MKKRLLAIIAAFVLAFSCAFFVACEDETVTPGTPGNEQDSDQGGSTGGDQGGSTGGDQGGSTGGNQGGNTGGDQGGSTGGDQGGNTGGDQGGSTGGDQGGSTGGDQGGNTGGDQGGSTGGDVTAYTYAVYAVSENAYTTAEAAIRGYIANELAGTVEIRSDVVFGFGKTPYDNKTADQTEGIATNSITATYGSHESKGAATLGDFGFTVAQKTGLLSLEKFTANVTLAFFEEFDRGDGSVAVAKVTSYPQNITQTIYVAKYGDTQYKYIVATPEQGERLTNTYMKAIASFTNYANCKVQMTMESLTSLEDTNGIYSFGDQLILTEDYLHWLVFENEEDFNSNRCTDEMYVAQRGENDWACVLPTASGWVCDDNVDSLEEGINAFLMDVCHLGSVVQYPAAMYTATANGFAFALQEVNGYRTETTVTVADGKITDVLYLVDCGDGDVSRTHITFTDFGTTVIVPPNEVLEAVQNSRA